MKISSKLVDIGFGIDGNFAAFRAMGFSNPEEGFTWSDGEISRVLLLDPSLKGTLMLILEGNPFLVPEQVHQQEIDVFFDGGCVASLSVQAPFFRAVSISSTGMSTHTLEFRYPSRRRPSEFGSSDTRELGVAWSRIRVYKIESAPNAQLSQPKDSDVSSARTLVTIAGNCFSESIAAGLLSDIEIEKKLQIGVVPLHLTSLSEESTLKAVAEASIILYQYLAGIDREAVYSLASESAKIIWYPDVVLRVIWPFDSTHWQQDEIAKQRNSLKIRHQDGALALLRRLEPDKKKRIQRYKDLDFGVKLDLPRLIDTQTRFLHDIDKKNDVKIGKYIAKNFRQRPLFYDCTHPSEFLVEELCSACADKLSIKWDRSNFHGFEGWKDWRLPVHPMIGQQLGLRWSGASKKYSYGSLGEVTWEQWVEAYIDEFG